MSNSSPKTVVLCLNGRMGDTPISVVKNIITKMENNPKQSLSYIAQLKPSQQKEILCFVSLAKMVLLRAKWEYKTIININEFLQGRYGLDWQTFYKLNINNTQDKCANIVEYLQYQLKIKEYSHKRLKDWKELNKLKKWTLILIDCPNCMPYWCSKSRTLMVQYILFILYI